MHEESIEKAVQRLIELNKDKLSDSQLVDLVASFYLVTNQCLKSALAYKHSILQFCAS